MSLAAAARIKLNNSPSAVLSARPYGSPQPRAGLTLRVHAPFGSDQGILDRLDQGALARTRR